MRMLWQEAEENIRRVRNILDLHQKAEAVDIGTNEERGELLRAAVVFLHSSIEEMVRNLFIERLPNLDRDFINELSFSEYGQTNRVKGVLLGDLAHHYRGRFVDNVVLDALNAHLDRLNINNADQLVAVLRKVGIDTSNLTPYLNDLGQIMRRRHQIVHQMDREDALDPDLRPITAIGIKDVERWLQATGRLHIEIMKQAANA